MMNMTTITGDKDFLTKMIAHHKMALTMCQQIYSITQRKEIRDLAVKMYNAQTEEIATMQAWLKQLP